MIHGWSAFGGPTMVGRTLDWKEELGRWLKPFLDRLGHKARRQMCPFSVSGLIGPGDRKSIQPMAERLALGEYDQLHHFIAAGVWENDTDEAGDRPDGDRSCDRGRCALWLCAGGCGLWDERAVPAGAHSSQTCLAHDETYRG